MDDEIAVAELRLFLGAASSVVHLEFGHGMNTELRVLQSVDILPRLRHLVILDSARNEFNYSLWRHERSPRHYYRELLQMLRQRKGTLESFELVLRISSKPSHDMAEFSAFRDEGLHVRITHDRDVILDTLPLDVRRNLQRRPSVLST
jgi:hypothetical protein